MSTNRKIMSMIQCNIIKRNMNNIMKINNIIKYNTKNIKKINNIIKNNMMKINNIIKNNTIITMTLSNMLKISMKIKIITMILKNILNNRIKFQNNNRILMMKNIIWKAKRIKINKHQIKNKIRTNFSPIRFIY